MDASAASPAAAVRRLPWWKKLLFSTLLVVAALAGVEALLAMAGVRPPLAAADPFVGFARRIPLFEPERQPDGTLVMVTARYKLGYFNAQRFPKDKRPGSYRIFCMGGSTTYGNPYTDSTSFCGWLREFLAAADPSRSWEVINAGGISYASYRVAALMEELAGYAPDLFVIYTGHNEFLEKRSYGRLADLPQPLLDLGSQLARTRLYTASATLLRNASVPAHAELRGEVDEMLSHAIGPVDYRRDDVLTQRIVRHFRVNLGRMVEIARGAGARTLFVVPAYNLHGVSPFKAEHRNGIGDAERRAWQQAHGRGMDLMAAGDPGAAAQSFQAAVAIDDRHADGWFRLGQALFAQGRHDEAREAFRRASDEDVCPLRSLTAIQRAVVEETARRGLVPIDFASLVDGWSRREHGHAVPGDEYFLDHVHPTIDGNRRLALAMMDRLVADGVVRPAAGWGEARIAATTQQVMARVDAKAHAAAIRHLGRLFGWAGKLDEAHAFLERGDAMFGGSDREALYLLGKSWERRGRPQEAVATFRRLLRTWPGDRPTHEELAHVLRSLRASPDERLRQYRDFVAAQPEAAPAHAMLGAALAREGRHAEAVDALREALRRDPRLAEAQARLADVLAEQGRDAEALEAYRALVRLAPDNADAHFNLGVVLARRRDSAQAMAAWRETLRLQPAHLPARLALADALATAGRLADAQAIYQAALQTAPESAEAHNDYGSLLARQGRLDEAVEQFREAVRLRPQFAEAHHNLGTALAQRGRPADGRPHLERARQLEAAGPAR